MSVNQNLGTCDGHVCSDHWIFNSAVQFSGMSGSMDFRILGPVALGGAPVSRPRERKILAALLVAGRPVSTGHLVDVLWPAAPPATARQQVQNCVSSLRRHLIRHDVRSPIAGRTDGYCLHVDEAQLDALVFERLCREARRAADRGDLATAGEQLRSALALWRGRPFADAESEVLAGAATELEERRIRAIGQYVRLMFGVDRHADVVGDLSGRVREHPYHEGLHAQLAEALERTGRPAEALRVVHALDARLRSELGTGVGACVAALERRLVRPNPGGPDGDLLAAIEAAIGQLSLVAELLHGAGPARAARGPGGRG